MSTLRRNTRREPRWSRLFSTEGTRVSEPASIRGLPDRVMWVRVGPPLSASGPSFGSVPYGRLPALVAEAVNPSGLPTALERRLTVVLGPARRSGSMAAALRETTVFSTLRTVFWSLVIHTPPP